MKRILGRSQTGNDAQWRWAIEHIEELITFDEVKRLEEATVEELIKRTQGAKCAFAWSGGKDGIVLAPLCEQAGISEGIFGHTNLDYPEFLNWCLKNKPKGVKPYNNGLDLDWLAEHEDLLFPRGNEMLGKWRNLNQIGPFAKMFADNGLDMLIVGHRTIDGNVCGKNNIIAKKSGEVRYSPMADWPHEAILGYLHYYGIEISPCYKWKNAFIMGTHIWPERPYTKSVMDGYAEVYEIDPTIVIGAAEKLPTARRFLEEVANR